MRTKRKVSLTIDEELYISIEKAAKTFNMAKSHLAQEALRLWLNNKTEKLMAKGYEEMANEDRLINWNPARGNEQAGIRPVLIIQNNIGNDKAPTTIVAAISSSIKLYPMNVKINPPEGGLDRPSIIKTSQILTVAKERLEKCLGRFNKDIMDDVDKAIKLSLALL